MALASLNAGEFLAKVSMKHCGFLGTIQLGNIARFGGSIRAVKLELSHSIRTETRYRALSKRYENLVGVNNQPFLSS